MSYKKLYLLDGIAKTLKAVAVVMVGFLLLQIAENYHKYGKQSAKTDEIHPNTIVNSYMQVNSKDSNLYIKSDVINIHDEEIVFRNNILNSNFGNGSSNMVIYNRNTKDVSLQERPKFTFSGL